VVVSRHADGQPAGAQRVRFSFETSSFREAMDVADQLRRITRNEVPVWPARPSHRGTYRWTVLATTDPLGAGEIAAFQEVMRRVARRAPGLKLTGWLFLRSPEEPAPAGQPPATSRVAMRVLIVDESATFRQAACLLLERRGYRVVGEADGAASGFDAVERLQPDAVLLDVRLPDGSGFDLCERLTREQGGPAVLLVSSNAAAAGAVGKACGARDLISKADLAHVDLRSIWV
jgi:CheY-like chemotaxis protein